MSEEPMPEAWWDLRADSSVEATQRDVLRTELNLEVGTGHILYGRGFSVVARSEADDDVLIALDNNNSWAVVHLTWRQACEKPPWPKTAVFDSLAEAIRSVSTD